MGSFRIFDWEGLCFDEVWDDLWLKLLYDRGCWGDGPVPPWNGNEHSLICSCGCTVAAKKNATFSIVLEFMINNIENYVIYSLNH